MVMIYPKKQYGNGTMLRALYLHSVVSTCLPHKQRLSCVPLSSETWTLVSIVSS